MAAGLRDFEHAMCARTASKVALSRASVASLHAPAFIHPRYHVSRKGMTLEHVMAVRAAGVSVATAEQGPEELEILAFAHALQGPGGRERCGYQCVVGEVRRGVCAVGRCAWAGEERSQGRSVLESRVGLSHVP
eukprot:835001-Rhodomonas_salina.1